MLNYNGYYSFLLSSLKNNEFGIDGKDNFGKTKEDYTKDIQSITKFILEKTAAKNGVELKNNGDYANYFKSIVEDSFNFGDLQLFDKTSPNDLMNLNVLDTEILTFYDNLSNKCIEGIEDKEWLDKNIKLNCVKDFYKDQFVNKQHNLEKNIENDANRSFNISFDEKTYIENGPEDFKVYLDAHKSKMELYEGLGNYSQIFGKGNEAYDNYGVLALDKFNKVHQKDRAVIECESNVLNTLCRQELRAGIKMIASVVNRYNDRGFLSKVAAFFGFGKAAADLKAIDEMKRYYIDKNVDKETLDLAVKDVVAGNKTSVNIEKLEAPLPQIFEKADDYYEYRADIYANKEMENNLQELNQYQQDKIKNDVEVGNVEKVAEKVVNNDVKPDMEIGGKN